MNESSMCDHDLVNEAASRLASVASAATASPWRQSGTEAGLRYSAVVGGGLVADKPHPQRRNPDAGGWGWDEGYGGCLIGESLVPADRAYLVAVQPVFATAVADWLRSVAAYPPPAAVALARVIINNTKKEFQP